MHRTSKAMIHEHASIHRRRIQAGLLRIPFSQVAVEEDGRLDLQLSGELPDDWCLRLANGLSMARIGLRNGYAGRVDDQVWICQLEVQHEDGAGRTPDFLDLAMRGTLRQRREEPPILDYELTDSTSRGGVLDLRVVAHDAVGLLAAVLHRVRAAGLALDELLLVTEDDAATHRMAIRRLDMSTPRALDRRAIAASLDQMVCSR